MNNSNLRSKLSKKDLTIGGWITIGSPVIAEIFAKAGFDWIVVDLEHSCISLQQAEELIRTIDLAGSSPLVRLTSNNKDLIKRVMDAGAHGIIVPNINTAKDAAYAVSSTRYAPLGNRGVGLSRAQGYGPGFQDYLSWQEAGPIVIPQIESKEAIPNIDQIFTTTGVDGFFVGPYDLSCSLGVPGDFTSTAYKKALETISSAGSRFNIPAGIHIVEPSTLQLQQSIAEGYKFIAFSLDTRILDSAARHAMSLAAELIS